ncbi:hypothetical protein [Dethiothermospora halolimnae]|uniref:hypothetical protein n=1 Tax=Dethiothermospora halolimnae TaxID=3114390 RepID=UPI003CCC3251
MKKKSSKPIALIVFSIVIIYVILQFTPKKITTVLEKYDAYFNDMDSLSIIGVDASVDDRLIYKIDIDDKDKIDALYDYFSKIKVRKIFINSVNNTYRNNPRKYYFTGFMNFTIISEKYLTLMDDDDVYINPEGFDLEKIKSLIDQ